jgi:hypothetical protein
MPSLMMTNPNWRPTMAIPKYKQPHPDATFTRIGDSINGQVTVIDNHGHVSSLHPSLYGFFLTGLAQASAGCFSLYDRNRDEWVVGDVGQLDEERINAATPQQVGPPADHRDWLTSRVEPLLDRG